VLEELEAEMEDRFGAPPVPVEQMLAVERLKYQAAEAGLQSVTLRGRELAVQYEPDGESAAAKLKSKAAGEGPVESAYIEERSRTVYLRLSLDVNKRQELLLKWLKSTIDDIIDARPADGSEHAP
jgi:transcription-repair coupling factor (superfamily II helicase)